MSTRRHVRGEIRATADESGVHYLTLQAITPGVADDYGSVWDPHCFDRSLAERLPTLAWGHDWTNPIGRACGYETSDDGPTIRFRLDSIPEAERAWQQCQPGPNGEPPTIDDCSVGFSNCERRDLEPEEMAKYPGGREYMIDADLDECSLVLRGAVPGAKVLALRAKGGRMAAEVDSEFVVELARRVQAGELTEDEARIAIDLAAADVPEGTAPSPVPVTEPVALDGDDPVAAKWLDGAVGRSRR